MDELVHVRVGAGAPPASLLLQMVVAGWCRGGISHLTVVTVSLLKLTQREAAPPGPAQAGFFEAPPGPVHAGSPPEVKLAFFGALFAARTDIYAARWDNARTGQKGWLPAVRGGWRKGIRHAERDYLPLTAEVLAAHLSGQMHIGLYPLLDGDRCSWLAADFDGTAAMLDALNYIKAARAWACRPDWKYHVRESARTPGYSSPRRSRRRRHVGLGPDCCERRCRCAAR